MHTKHLTDLRSFSVLTGSRLRPDLRDRAQGGWQLALEGHLHGGADRLAVGTHETPD